MSLVNEGGSTGKVNPRSGVSTATCRSVSYRVITCSIWGANFGGAQMTQAGEALIHAFVPLRSTEALTGPSETSSCQPSLSANVNISGSGIIGEPDFPEP